MSPTQALTRWDRGKLLVAASRPIWLLSRRFACPSGAHESGCAPMSAATVVSLAIGAWGAAVATILGAREIKRSRRSLKVICRWGVAQHDSGGYQKVILVRAINEGSRPVELHGVTFRFEDGKELMAIPIAGGADQNKLLGDGQSASFHYDRGALEEAEHEAQTLIAHAIVSDASTNEYIAPYEH